MNDEKILLEATKAASQELTKQAYADVKYWLTRSARWIKKKYERVTTEKFDSPNALLQALTTGQVSDGDRVTLRCKPSLFGPFLRSHFLTPITGFNTNLRLGPRIPVAGPLGMAVQITSQLTPVGLYPPIDQTAQQACLYPPDTASCGFVGVFAGVDRLITYLPALLSPRHTPFCNMPCNITGVARLITAQTLAESGFSPEICEEVRQQGATWFLDATSEDSECKPLSGAVTGEMWGGLYASGHLEMASGQLRISEVVDALKSAMSLEGYDPGVTQNKAGAQEMLIFAEGFRAVLDTQYPIYSFHMDAELGLDFKSSRRKFDAVTTAALNNIATVCDNNSVDLRNKLDLDFSYTDGTSAYSVLKSIGAEQIKDPLAVAIRDWHRSRGK